MIHFSILLTKSVCGLAPRGNTPFQMTGASKEVSCSRCKAIIDHESATGADLWALEAEQERRKHGNLSDEHIRALYVLALEKREAALARAKEAVEYAMDELRSTAARAVEAGVRR